MFIFLIAVILAAHLVVNVKSERFYHSSSQHQTLSPPPTKPVLNWPSTGSSVAPDEWEIDRQERVRRAFDDTKLKEAVLSQPGLYKQTLESYEKIRKGQEQQSQAVDFLSKRMTTGATQLEQLRNSSAAVSQQVQELDKKRMALEKEMEQRSAELKKRQEDDTRTAVQQGRALESIAAQHKQSMELLQREFAKGFSELMAQTNAVSENAMQWKKGSSGQVDEKTAESAKLALAQVDKLKQELQENQRYGDKRFADVEKRHNEYTGELAKSMRDFKEQTERELTNLNNVDKLNVEDHKADMRRTRLEMAKDRATANVRTTEVAERMQQTEKKTEEHLQRVTKLADDYKELQKQVEADQNYVEKRFKGYDFTQRHVFDTISDFRAAVAVQAEKHERDVKNIEANRADSDARLTSRETLFDANFARFTKEMATQDEQFSAFQKKTEDTRSRTEAEVAEMRVRAAVLASTHERDVKRLEEDRDQTHKRLLLHEDVTDSKFKYVVDILDGHEEMFVPRSDTGRPWELKLKANLIGIKTQLVKRTL